MVDYSAAQESDPLIGATITAGIIFLVVIVVGVGLVYTSIHIINRNFVPSDMTKIRMKNPWVSISLFGLLGALISAFYLVGKFNETTDHFTWL